MAIFSASAIGYVDNPEALYARAIGWGLHERGHHVRMLEERRNPMLRKTLETVGSDASRAVFEKFPGVLVHGFEPRRGAPLMEWLARELSLVDLAIVVDGLPTEVARWIANLDHRALHRAFVTYRPEELTDERAAEIELERFDTVFSTSAPAASTPWVEIQKSIAPQDYETISPQHLPDLADQKLATPDDVARLLESVMLIENSV